MLSLISEIPRPKTLARKKDVAFRQARHPLEGCRTVWSFRQKRGCKVQDVFGLGLGFWSSGLA